MVLVVEEVVDTYHIWYLEYYACNCKDTSTVVVWCPGGSAFYNYRIWYWSKCRTAVGDGEGIYSGFFNTTNITKVALVHGHDGSGSITPGSGGLGQDMLFMIW